MTDRHSPADLVAAYTRIAGTRMSGVPLLNPALQVEAVGFARETGPQADEQGWLGMLVTPWLMSLVWWPDDGRHAAAVGETRTHAFGAERYGFIGAHEEGLGHFEMCSLFSPMGEFEDAAGARAVAEEALRALRDARAAATVAAPARRAFLTGQIARRAPEAPHRP